MKTHWLIINPTDTYDVCFEGFTESQADELALCIEAQFGVKEFRNTTENST